jgi:hypothetical protein
MTLKDKINDNIMENMEIVKIMRSLIMTAFNFIVDVNMS